MTCNKSWNLNCFLIFFFLLELEPQHDFNSPLVTVVWGGGRGGQKFQCYVAEKKVMEQNDEQTYEVKALTRLMCKWKKTSKRLHLQRKTKNQFFIKPHKREKQLTVSHTQRGVFPFAGGAGSKSGGL